ncbi:hypothetical protein K1719_027858 [Acacia pycnantha]|nr:hypothetical protein K1719_027858 [Acacia pycnantha]
MPRLKVQVLGQLAIQRLKHQLLAETAQPDTKWRKPTPGYVWLDVDASIRNHNQAAVGGLIRDDTGSWIYKLQKVQAFSDSLEALNILLRDNTSDHPFKAEIEATRQLMYGDWDVVLSHSSRESIECADILAKEAHAVDMQLRVIPQVHPRCRIRFMLDNMHVGDDISFVS